MDIKRKISGLKPDEIITKAVCWLGNRTSATFRECYARAGGLAVKPSGLPFLVKGTPIDIETAVESIFDSIYRLSPDDHIITSLVEKHPDSIEDLLKEADRFVEKKFSILGVDVDYSSGIRWHYDPANDYEFKANIFHSNIRHSNRYGGFDIKYPWELSRLQHFPKLALAYRNTRDKKYRKALIEQTSDWFRSNPTGFGVNWSCAMDVAIRVANLVYAYAILNDHHLDSNFKLMLVSGLIEHGRFITANLEWNDELTSNHYLGDIAGLAVLSAFLSEAMPEAEEWLEFCHGELQAEINKQVYPDGWDFEASTAYHRLVYPMFLYTAALIELAGLGMGDEYYSRLDEMKKFMWDIGLPDGSFPLIGDNDSGFFISMGQFPLEVFFYPLSHVNHVMKSGDLTLSESKYEHRLLSEYSDGGLWVMRSKDGSDLVTFRLGSVGQNGNGGHAHNDQLSITVFFNGKPVIIDPGSAVYTSDPAKRNFYRATSSHATIAFKDLEQNKFIDGELFKLPQTQQVVFGEARKFEDSATVSGATLGFDDYSHDDVKIDRTVSWHSKSRTVEIGDEVKLHNRVSFLKPEWYFPLGDAIDVKLSGDGHLDLIDVLGKCIAEFYFPANWSFELQDTYYSPGYGVEIPSKKIKLVPPDGILSGKFSIRALMDSTFRPGHD